MKQSAERGITIVEALLGIAIAGIVIVFISHTLTLFLTSSEETLNRTQALYLAEEGQEILRYLRDSDWAAIEDDLTNGTTYYLEVSTTTLGTTTVSETVGGVFIRSFEISEVRRDSTTDDIVTSGGVVDDGARWVTFSVNGYGATSTIRTLLTNIFGV